MPSTFTFAFSTLISVPGILVVIIASFEFGSIVTIYKAAYKQLLDNTNLEICACNEKGEFLRVQGTANFDNTPEAQAAAFKIMPQLADMYNEETGLKLGIIYLDHLSAKLFSMSGSVKDIMAY